MSEAQDYEWHETPYGKFRVAKTRFGTWNSFGEDGEESHHRTYGRTVVMAGTRFYLEGVATNWANCVTSQQFDGTVGGKL
jgi:hypothetical protein